MQRCFIGLLLIGFGLARAAGPAAEWEETVLPWLENYCYDCHGDGIDEGELDFDEFDGLESMIAQRQRWKRIRGHIEHRLMPPPDEFQPPLEDRARIIDWIDRAIFPTDPENPDPGRVTLRRLNRIEYQNTIRDLLGVRIDVEKILPPDDSGYGFDNIGDVLTLSPAHLDRFLQAARTALSDAVPLGPDSPQPKSHRRIFGERPKGASDEVWATDIFRRFARRAFRRPPRPGEAKRYLHFTRLAASSGKSFEAGIRHGLEAMLVSPAFLFREEPQRDGGDGIQPIDEHSLASRLSYFLWSTMPDRRLRDLADAGELRRNLDAEIERMLDSPRSQQLVSNFAGQWLQLRDVKNVRPSRQAFPEFDWKMRDHMAAETRLLVAHLIRHDRPLTELLNADYSFLNERLAKHYGIDGVEGDEFRRVTLSGTRRRGLLGHGSFLVLTSHPLRTSPVLRGKYVLENLLDTAPPPPPPNVPQLAEPKHGGTGLSLRQQMERHRADPACSSCHALMDPIGFGLEHFDADGSFRSEENGHPIDASGQLASGRRFAGAAELREILVRDHRHDFLRAAASKLLTYALGRGVDWYDKPAVERIISQTEQDGGRTRAMIRAVVHSVPFQFRRGDP